MKNLILFLTFIAFAAKVNAQVTQEWVQTYPDGKYAEYNSGMVLDNAGNIYVAGESGSPKSMLLQKYDASGTLIWSQSFLPSGSSSASAYAVAIDSNGDLIITGVGGTVKYDANGQLLWSVTANFTSNSVATDELNNIYIRGYVSNILHTVKYNAAGTQQWDATYNFDPDNNGAFILDKRIVYKNGYVYETGQAFVQLSGGGGKTRCVLTLKYNATNGALAWASTYSHADKLSQYGIDLTVDGTGYVYVTGVVYNKVGKKQDMNWVTLKYNSSGIQQWVKIYDGNADDSFNPSWGQQGSDFPCGITLDNTNNIIVCGASWTLSSSGTGHDLTTIKYNATGTQLWVKTYDDPAHPNASANAQAVTTDASSNVYITSPSYAVTVKYNSAGNQQWAVNYGNGKTNNVSLDASGNVYVCGRNIPNTLLIKYSQGGGGSIANKDRQLESRGEANTVTDKILNSIQLYPNPAVNQITIQNNNNDLLGSVIIYNAAQQMVHKQFSGQSKMDIDIKKLTPGIYYLKSEQQSSVAKFTKL